MTITRLERSSVAVVSHVFATGPGHELADYLRTRAEKVAFIRHPFAYARDIRSSRDIHIAGKCVVSRKARSWRLPGVLMFAKDLLFTIVWIVQEECRFELYVGIDDLNCFAGLLLRRLGRVRVVVYYTIDYVPSRFKNRILNHLYHLLDVHCVTNADSTWNLSPRMSAARSRFLAQGKAMGRQKTVPMGVRLGRLKPMPLDQIDRRRLVFIGHLRKGHGTELIVQSMPKIIEKVPETKLTVIGTGPLWGQLKQLVTNLGLEKNVDFRGFIENHEDAEKILVKCAVGLAPYEPTSQNFTFYTDPGKPKLYLACGLPVIITPVPWIAEAVARREMGVVVDFDDTAVAEAAVRLLTNDEFYERCRKNALAYASQLDWNQIFDSALQSLLEPSLKKLN